MLDGAGGYGYGGMATGHACGHHYKLRYVRQVGSYGTSRSTVRSHARAESTLSSHCAENAYQVHVGITCTCTCRALARSTVDLHTLTLHTCTRSTCSRSRNLHPCFNLPWHSGIHVLYSIHIVIWPNVFSPSQSQIRILCYRMAQAAAAFEVLRRFP